MHPSPTSYNSPPESTEPTFDIHPFCFAGDPAIAYLDLLAPNSQLYPVEELMENMVGRQAKVSVGASEPAGVARSRAPTPPYVYARPARVFKGLAWPNGAFS